MGKRNLAVVGTHDDYFADMFDEETGNDPSLVVDCASAEDAATSYFRDVFENSNAMIRAATIAVWPVSGSVSERQVFEARAELVPCTDVGEYDVTLHVSEKSE